MSRFKYRIWSHKHKDIRDIDGFNSNWKSGKLTVRKEDILMQCVGISDSKGNDIYEGDVIFIAGIGNVAVTWKYGAWDFGGYDYLDIIEDLEHIVGNVHENKDKFTITTA